MASSCDDKPEGCQSEASRTEEHSTQAAFETIHGSHLFLSSTRTARSRPIHHCSLRLKVESCARSELPVTRLLHQ